MNINLTLVIQGLAFFATAWLVMKFGWPHIIGAIEERQKKIADGLAAAEEGKRALASASEKQDQVIREARGEAAGTGGRLLQALQVSYGVAARDGASASRYGAVTDDARFELDETLLGRMAPGVELAPIRAALAGIEAVCAGGPAAGALGTMSARSRFHWLVAPRSTVVQVSAVHTGRCRDLDAALDDQIQALLSGLLGQLDGVTNTDQVRDKALFLRRSAELSQVLLQVAPALGLTVTAVVDVT